ncbi:MAG: hypothetical protein RLZZ126_2 [Pseudomonadota bacterium]|jgi:glycosyltransferase involved in cell wall biosynthesis
MSTPLSSYVLTFNSERRLHQVLTAISAVADEIVVIDSGSTDNTLSIAESCGTRVLHRKFDNFRDQRIFAEDSCTHDWVLALDSDEVLSDELQSTIKALKETDFFVPNQAPVDGFSIRYLWYFLGAQVSSFYPVRSPQYIVRLFRRSKISFRGSRIIHEALQLDNAKIFILNEPILHYSCDSIDGLYSKIGLYTKLSAEDMHANGVKATWIKIHIYPWLIWVRFYLLYGGWRDGENGRILGRYVRDTIYLKYLKLRHMSTSK